MATLPDVNLTLALAFSEHAHSESAKAWLLRQSNPGSIIVCRVVQMGLLRLLTQRSVMGTHLLDAAEAWSCWSEMIADERFLFMDEPSGIEREWNRLCAALPAGSSVNTDTYLAAFAQASGLTLITFDGGFARFPRLSVEILFP